MLGYYLFFFLFVSAALLPVFYSYMSIYKSEKQLKLISKVSNSSKAKEADPTMNDIERNTLLLLCAMFHGFLNVPVGQLSSSSRDSCRRAVALQLLSAAVRGGFQGLAHRCRAWGS